MHSFPVFHKNLAIAAQSNMGQYEPFSEGFSWQKMREALRLPRGNGVNKATICLDDHPPEVMQRTALIWQPTFPTDLVGKIPPQERFSFEDLRVLTNRFANVLTDLGIRKGDRVFVYLERIPEQYIAIFGILKVGAIAGPLFSAFGPDAIQDRLQDSKAALIVTSPELKPRLDSIADTLPALRHMVLVNRSPIQHANHSGSETIEVPRTDSPHILTTPHPNPPPQGGRGHQSASKANQSQEKISPNQLSGNFQVHAYEDLMAKASPAFEVPYTEPDDFSIIHYTSGTTGKPKGAVHGHGAIVAQAATAQYILDLQPEKDIYWCTADPGWVTGTSYGMLGPWALGATVFVYEGGFKAETWYQLIQENRITVWYTAPTAIRMLMKAGDALPGEYDLSSLRYCCSVGEPLNPEAVVWGEKVLGHVFHDTWWQTETGSMQICNYPSMSVKPGSMGKPFPGVTAGILDDDWTLLPMGEEGLLALRPDSPSLFKTYWNREDQYRSKFKNGWYITGDRAKMDSEGYYWFIGRSDDVINTAGHLVGPFEVESALIEHPAVAEAGVIGKPDAERLEIIKAFVSLKEGFSPTELLQKEIQQFVRGRLAAHAYPREIEFIASLPKTRSGKIMRRLLKARELGLPEGDISTLE